MFLQQLINGLTIGGIYAMIAVGYTMIYGVIQLINFAHGEVYMLGAFFAFTFIFLLWLEERKRFRPPKKGGSVTASIVGASVGVFGRFCAHLVSGVVFFASYAPVGMSPLIYSAIYNGSYIIPELLVSVYLIYLLVKSGLIEAYK